MLGKISLTEFNDLNYSSTLFPLNLTKIKFFLRILQNLLKYHLETEARVKKLIIVVILLIFHINKK